VKFTWIGIKRARGYYLKIIH